MSKTWLNWLESGRNNLFLYTATFPWNTSLQFLWSKDVIMRARHILFCLQQPFWIVWLRRREKEEGRPRVASIFQFIILGFQGLTCHSTICRHLSLYDIRQYNICWKIGYRKRSVWFMTDLLLEWLRMKKFILWKWIFLFSFRLPLLDDHRHEILGNNDKYWYRWKADVTAITTLIEPDESPLTRLSRKSSGREKG
jgi:hypothetical protein